jgi:hypothetical protein
MGFCSIGKNELKGLLEKETRMKMELEAMAARQIPGDVVRLKSESLKHEIAIIHNKLKLLSPEDDDIA